MVGSDDYLLDGGMGSCYRCGTKRQLEPIKLKEKRPGELIFWNKLAKKKRELFLRVSSELQIFIVLDFIFWIENNSPSKPGTRSRRRRGSGACSAR